MGKENIRAGVPAAPGDTSLPLLPLGPDGVRRAPPRRTHPDERRIPDVEGDVNYILAIHIRSVFPDSSRHRSVHQGRNFLADACGRLDACIDQLPGSMRHLDLQHYHPSYPIKIISDKRYSLFFNKYDKILSLNVVLQYYR